MSKFLTALNAVKDHFAPPPAGPSLKMVPATSEEEFLIRKRRWMPPYTLSGFIALEQQIASCGAKQWISFEDGLDKLQDKQHLAERNIVGSFKTASRRALLATRSTDNQVRIEEIQCKLMSSLFVFEEFRRKGFAQKMMRDMKTVIQAPNAAQNEDLRFLYFYSIVGKDLYEKAGWQSVPATYMTLPVRPPSEAEGNFGNAGLLRVNEIEELCLRDEEIVRDELVRYFSKDDTMKFAILGDWATISRIQACEELAAKDTSTPALIHKGSIATNSSCTAWCLWTRVFRRTGEIDFHISRSQVDTRSGKEAGFSEQRISQDATSALAAVLRAAQTEAGIWGCTKVTLKNPPIRVVRAVHHIDPSVQILPRDTIAIPFLHWFGDEDKFGNVDWIENECHCDL